MMQKLKSILLTLGAMSVALLPTFVLLPATASAATTGGSTIYNNLCTGTNLSLDTTGGNASCGTTTDTNFQTLLTKVINIFTIVVGVIAVVMIIVGGLRYITSGGESSKVGGAKTTIIYALIGLVVVALAQLIVHFVLNQANSVVTGC